MESEDENVEEAAETPKGKGKGKGKRKRKEDEEDGGGLNFFTVHYDAFTCLLFYLILVLLVYVFLHSLL